MTSNGYLRIENTEPCTPRQRLLALDDSSLFQHVVPGRMYAVGVAILVALGIVILIATAVDTPAVNIVDGYTGRLWDLIRSAGSR